MIASLHIPSGVLFIITSHLKLYSFELWIDSLNNYKINITVSVLKFVLIILVLKLISFRHQFIHTEMCSNKVNVLRRTFEIRNKSSFPINKFHYICSISFSHGLKCGSAVSWNRFLRICQQGKCEGISKLRTFIHAPYSRLCNHCGNALLSVSK